jgi:hypothetical protein
MQGGGGIATSHLDSMLLSSIKAISQGEMAEKDFSYPSYIDNPKY